MAVQTVPMDRMLVAHAGMIADTSIRQIDGATAALDRIYAGRPVVVTKADNNTKSVKPLVPADLGTLPKMVGIAVFSHYGCVKGFYDVGDAVNVMRIGRIWAVTTLTAAPDVSSLAKLQYDDGTKLASVGTAGDNVIPGWVFTGGFETMPDGTHIAEVELTIVNTAPAAAPSA